MGIAVERALVEKTTRERLDVQAGAKKRQSTRRMWSEDRLPMVRAFFRGPKWRRLCGVTEVPIAQIDPAAAAFHRPGRKLLMFSLEDEVRERICVELRPDVYAMWSDVREGMTEWKNTKQKKSSKRSEV